MSFAVRELPRAKEDKQAILEWLLERSRQGAAAWLDAYDDALARLSDHADTYGQALEDKNAPQVDVRQVLFQTRHGRVLQAAPPGFDPAEFDRRLAALPGVTSSHHTHSWTLDGDHHVFSTHVVMGAGTSSAGMVAMKRKVRDMLRPHRFMHVTVEVELEGEICPDDNDED